jgi:hypothetical protein
MLKTSLAIALTMASLSETAALGNTQMIVLLYLIALAALLSFNYHAHNGSTK